MQNSFLKRIISKPPILFPWAALFQIVITIAAVVTLYPTPLGQQDWLRPLCMALFSVIWLFVCDMRKWAAMSYIVFTMLCLGLHYFTKMDTPERIFSDAFFPFDMVLSFFILLYYKKFQ
jgi:hypothetical protein